MCTQDQKEMITGCVKMLVDNGIESFDAFTVWKMLETQIFSHKEVNIELTTLFAEGKMVDYICLARQIPVAPDFYHRVYVNINAQRFTGTASDRDKEIRKHYTLEEQRRILEAIVYGGRIPHNGEF